MGTRLMTPEAARRIARAHPGSGFARRSARASHNNSQRDAQSQAALDKEEQSQNRKSGSGSGYGTTHADQCSAASTDSGQKQTAGEDQCSHCTPENLCSRHANSWTW
ncbi:hypothetical protein MFRU_019g00520 [Monilinia fructicola]|uniref:Uncharacterized protein n=1 Tax=Monilinia fructicola TaxID=38448 RepID=A0A5M9JEQ1_MONFR|nr:hypothetical protein EYC84_008895 [Monilinia fructicola]KAG4028762.1 hypothetical protein MFRU_019g00520 [Monilinia fructicola]